MKKQFSKPLSIALGTAFVIGGASTVFAAEELPQGYEAGDADRMELMAGGHEGKCGEGKCGGGDDDEKGGEGKCGEGKCGA